MLIFSRLYPQNLLKIFTPVLSEVTRGTMNSDKSMNHNNLGPSHKGEDRNYMQSLRHQSSAPKTYYEKNYDSSNEVVFGAA